jgi:hypothetical protein
VLWKVFFFCSRKGAEQQSRKGISFFAAPLLCETFFFLFTQRRRAAKPQRDLDLGDFPSLGDILFLFTQRRKVAEPQRGLDLGDFPSLRDNFFLFTRRRRAAKPQRGLDLGDFPSLRDNLFFCSRKGAEQQSRKGVLTLATSLLCEIFFFLFTQRRRVAKPQRGLDLGGSPSLRDNLFFVHAKAKSSKAAKGFLSLRLPFFAACPAALRGESFFGECL